MVFHLDFANNTILSCFFFFFWMGIFLIPSVIAPIFNPITEVIIPIGIPIKDLMTEIEIHPVIGEAKIRK